MFARILFSLKDLTSPVCRDTLPVTVSPSVKPFPEIDLRYNVFPLTTSIFATDLLFVPTTYSPILNGLAFGFELVPVLSFKILDESSSGEGETVADSKNIEPVPSSLAIPSISLCEDRTSISASRYSKYALRNSSNTGPSSLKYSGSREGSL